MNLSEAIHELRKRGVSVVPTNNLRDWETYNSRTLQIIKMSERFKHYAYLKVLKAKKYLREGRYFYKVYGLEYMRSCWLCTDKELVRCMNEPRTIWHKINKRQKRHQKRRKIRDLIRNDQFDNIPIRESFCTHLS